MLSSGVSTVKRIQGLNAFPNRQRPAVIWAGLADADWLVSVAAVLSSCCEEQGFEPEQRGYTPHITLARVKPHRGRGPARLEWLAELLEAYADEDFGPTMIDELVLFSSELRSDGPDYRRLETVAL